MRRSSNAIILLVLLSTSALLVAAIDPSYPNDSARLMQQERVKEPEQPKKPEDAKKPENDKKPDDNKKPEENKKPQEAKNPNTPIQAPTPNNKEPVKNEALTTSPPSNRPTDQPTDEPTKVFTEMPTPTPAPVRPLPGSLITSPTTSNFASTVSMSDTSLTTTTESTSETSSTVFVSSTTLNADSTTSASITVGSTSTIAPLSTTISNPTTTTAQSTETTQISFLGSTNGRFTASDITDMYIRDNTILDDVTRALWEVSIDVLGDLFVDVDELVDQMTPKADQKRIRSYDFENFEEVESTLFENVQRDVVDVDCPTGLLYSPSDAPCLEFTFTFTPLLSGPITPLVLQSFVIDVSTLINNGGELYNSIKSTNPDSPIVGMGSPGGGRQYYDNQSNENSYGVDAINSVEVTKLGSTKFQSNIGTGGIVAVAISLAVVVIVLVTVLIRVIPNS